MILLLVKRIKVKRSKNNFSKLLEYKAIFVQPQNLLLTKSFFFFSLFFTFIYLFIYLVVYLFIYLFIYLFVFAL